MKTSLLLLSVILILTGCANTFTVRVERAVNAPDSRLSLSSTYGRKLVVSMRALQSCRAAYQSLAPQVAEFMETARETAPKQPTIQATNRLESSASALDSDLVHLRKSQVIIEEQLQRMKDLFETNTPEGLAVSVQRELIEAITLLAAENAWLGSFSQEISTLEQSTESNAKLEKLATEARSMIADTKENVEATTTSVVDAGFGGFRNLGVYVLDPSDEAYKKLLISGQTPLSWESLGQNRCVAYGDSSVMVVEETPAYFRTYQVSNNPQQLIQNLAGLVSKATAAAAKYLTGVPVP